MQYRNTSYAEGAYDTYWFEKNLQGDIVAVYSETGTKLIAYTYDAWGNFSTTYYNGGANTTATYNPFRYRGYYYDAELGFYYLNSRYYDPAIGRFINADRYVNANGDILGFNMYAYCGNNPVNYVDYSGSIAIADDLIILGLGFLAVSFCTMICSPGFQSAWNDACTSVANAVTDAVENVQEKVEEKIEAIDRAHNKTYSVYFLEDTDGKIQYVGRVTDDGYEARMKYHEKTKKLTPQLRVSGLTYTQARGLEEAGMIACHTLKGTAPNNKIHGISLKNKNRVYYLESALGYLLNHEEEKLLNMFNY